MSRSTVLQLSFEEIIVKSKGSKTPKPGKDASQAMKRAAKTSTKSGQKVTRPPTPDRAEVRQQTTHRQGHTK
ncbi:MAG: hypothetical protein WD229_02415 [Pirellulales bacterium]